MPENSFHLATYLERIHYAGPLSPSTETLRHLHRAQKMSIPFENLDLFLGQPIQLDPASLVAKLVDGQRGGYCYELNGLFLLALQDLGFSVTPLAARVFHGDTLMQKSHQALLVKIGDENWLADVGFGGSCLIEAIPLELECEFPQHFDTYRLKTDSKLGFVLQYKLGEQWRNLYAFSLEEYYPADYRMMNHFTSTSPASTFTQHIVCALTTADARIILYNSDLKIRSQHETVTTHLADKDAYRETLQRFLGIVLQPGARLQSPSSQFSMTL